MRQALIYLPGIDGTGRLLHRQTRLLDEYEVDCLSYPQDRVTSYAELAGLGERALEGSRGRLPGVVVADSFGGAVALTLTLKRPELIERLVLVNTFAYYSRRPAIKFLAWVGAYLPNRAFIEPWTSFRDTLFFTPEVSAAERALWWQRIADVPLIAYGRRFAMIAGLDLRPKLPAIDKPTVVLAAVNDRIVPASAGRYLARHLPHARLLQTPVAHGALIHPRIDIARWLAEWHG